MSEKSINVSIGSQRPIEVSVGEKKPINVSFEGGITGGDFKNGGDNAIADRRIGNKTAFALSIITNDEDRIIIGADGGITFNDGVEITRFVDDV
ncbi:MAG: hypothetical protein GY870_16240, partial [archaeon]|nr:hypothetical protein [archaeon]